MAKARNSGDVYVDITFPSKGLHVTEAFGRQPPETTPEAVNVRAYDPATGRLRGASRPGCSKQVATTVNSTNAVQMLDTVIDTTIATPANYDKMNANRTIRLIAVAGGVLKYSSGGAAWTTANLAGSPNVPTLSSSVAVIRSAYNSLILFIVDGTNYNYYAASTNTLYKWTATYGTLPLDAGNKPCRNIATWRARTCLAGLPGDPNNWFFSAVYTGEGGPEGAGGGVDFSYAPPVTQVTQAVSGNNAPAGLCQDIVTALVPYSDDVLIFGGDHTVWAMVGDPMNGGRLDLVSDRIGFAWGDAWCKDPFGTIYFLSNQASIYTLVPGQKPVKLSSQIDPLLARLRMDSINARLQWDENLQGFHVYTTILAAAAADIHYFWERRTGAWWQVTFENTAFSPLACANYDGNLPGDRVSLFAGRDGYVRGWSLTAEDDDGTAISSSVTLGPISTANMFQLNMKEMQSSLGVESGSIGYGIHVGNNEEEALSAAADVTGTLEASTSNTQPIRRNARATYIKVASTNRWSMEKFRLQLKAGNKVRMRNKGTWTPPA